MAAGAHTFVRITLVGGVATEADPPGSVWANPDPHLEERRRLGLARRRFWRALCNATPELNASVFHYPSRIIDPASSVWETASQFWNVVTSNVASSFVHQDWMIAGAVLRTAASASEAEALRASVLRFCDEGDVALTYAPFEVNAPAEAPDDHEAATRAAALREDPLLRCVACKTKLAVRNRCTRCHKVRRSDGALIDRARARVDSSCVLRPGQVSFCNAACQKAAWKVHKLVCLRSIPAVVSPTRAANGSHSAPTSLVIVESAPTSPIRRVAGSTPMPPVGSESTPPLPVGADGAPTSPVSVDSAPPSPVGAESAHPSPVGADSVPPSSAGDADSVPTSSAGSDDSSAPAGPSADSNMIPSPVGGASSAPPSANESPFEWSCSLC